MYNVLTMGRSEKVIVTLQNLMIQYNFGFTAPSTIREAKRLLAQKVFHLLIVDLEYPRSIRQTGWLADIRRISFVPVVVLSDTPEEDVRELVHFGADMCISGKWPCSLIADLAYAQLRRYTEYNHYSDLSGVEVSAFQIGDIFIDPARQEIAVCGQPVNLRHREFSLLLYFMQNPTY